MRILIDLQACQSSSRFRGIGRYAMSITQAIIRNAGQHEIFLALSAYAKDDIISLRQAFRHLIPPERFIVFAIPGPLAGIDPLHKWRVRASELIRWHALNELEPDIIYATSMFEGFVDNVTTSIESFTSHPFHAVTLYDLIPLKNQDAHLTTAAHREWYFKKIASLERADLLLAISEYSKNEAIELLKVKTENIINVSAGVSDRFHPLSLSRDESVSFLKKYSITRPFLLYTGNLDANKNLKGTLESYAMLPLPLRKIHQLVIVSQMDENSRISLSNLMARCGLRHDEVVFTGYVSDEALVRLYNLCRAFIFPSLYEGFGLPVLEAMACGAACLGSNLTSIPEVIGRQDALFDPYKMDSIAQAMIKVLTEEGFRNNLKAHAVARASLFSWEESARRILTAFDAMFARKSCKISRSRSVKNNQEFNFRANYELLVNELSQIDVGIEPTEEDLRQAACSIAFNQRHSTERQLLIDVSTIVSSDAKTGIQRVVRSILQYFLNAPPMGFKIRPVYGDDKIGYFRYADRLYANLDNADFKGHEAVIDYRRGDIFLGLDLSAHLFPVFTPVLSNFRTLGVTVHFLVYDILPLLHEQWFAPGMYEFFAEWMKAISQHADSLVCISASVANEVRSWIDEHPPDRPDRLKIRHFHLGGDINNSVPTKGIPKDASRLLAAFKSKPTFLMVGTIEPRKGHSQVLDAFERLWKNGESANLVIVGKEGWQMGSFTKKLRDNQKLGQSLFWLEGISDEFLDLTYANASALIAASEAEGFGLPLIEAACHKLPIIARDIAVFREVAGENAFYFKGPAPADLENAIVEWLHLRRRGEIPDSCAMSWLTWDQSARLLLDTILDSNSEEDKLCSRRSYVY